jgi:hypothetical protein
MFIIFDETRNRFGPPAEHWEWLNATTGTKLLDFWPGSGKYSHSGLTDRCNGWQQAVSIAYKRMGKRPDAGAEYQPGDATGGSKP